MQFPVLMLISPAALIAATDPDSAREHRDNDRFTSHRDYFV
jgi:hypothetical protein